MIEVLNVRMCWDRSYKRILVPIPDNSSGSLGEMIAIAKNWTGEKIVS